MLHFICLTLFLSLQTSAFFRPTVLLRRNQRVSLNLKEDKKNSVAGKYSTSAQRFIEEAQRLRKEAEIMEQANNQTSTETTQYGFIYDNQDFISNVTSAMKSMEDKAKREERPRILKELDAPKTGSILVERGEDIDRRNWVEKLSGTSKNNDLKQTKKDIIDVEKLIKLAEDKIPDSPKVKTNKNEQKETKLIDIKDEDLTLMSEWTSESIENDFFNENAEKDAIILRDKMIDLTFNFGPGKWMFKQSMGPFRELLKDSKESFKDIESVYFEIALLFKLIDEDDNDEDFLNFVQNLVNDDAIVSKATRLKEVFETEQFDVNSIVNQKVLRDFQLLYLDGVLPPDYDENDFYNEEKEGELDIQFSSISLSKEERDVAEKVLKKVMDVHFKGIMKFFFQWLLDFSGSVYYEKGSDEYVLLQLQIALQTVDVPDNEKDLDVYKDLDTEVVLKRSLALQQMIKDKTLTPESITENVEEILNKMLKSTNFTVNNPKSIKLSMKRGTNKERKELIRGLLDEDFKLLTDVNDQLTILNEAKMALKDTDKTKENLLNDQIELSQGIQQVTRNSVLVLSKLLSTLEKLKEEDKVDDKIDEILDDITKMKVKLPVILKDQIKIEKSKNIEDESSILSNEQKMLKALNKEQDIGERTVYELNDEIEKVFKTLNGMVQTGASNQTTFRNKVKETNSSDTFSLQSLKSQSQESVEEEEEAEDAAQLRSFFEQMLFNSSLLNDEDEDLFGGSSAEVFINEYFDSDSRYLGKTVSREGAGRFQNQVLKNTMTVSSIKMSQGAVIFNGKPYVNSASDMIKKIAENYEKSEFKDEVNYVLLQNNLFPSIDNGLEQAAIESLVGSSPAIIVFPKEWNSTVSAVRTNPVIRLWRGFLSSLSFASAFGCSAVAAGLLDTKSEFFTTGVVPESFLPMLAASVFIQNSGNIVELIVAQTKNITLSQVTVPSYDLFNFGSRSTFLNMPENRNQIFDVAISGILTSLILSFLAFYTGLQLTESSTPEIIATFPTVPLSMLRLNTIIAEAVQPVLNFFSSIGFGEISSSTGLAIGSSSSPGTLASVVEETQVHLHWLAVVGAYSFIGNIFQLVPIDNSVGSKLVYATLGREQFFVISVISGFSKLLFLTTMIFNLGGYAAMTMMSKSKLLLDYILFSQLLGSDRDMQPAKDNLTELSEERKYLAAGLLLTLFISFFPYGQLVSLTDAGLTNGLEYLKGLIAQGSNNDLGNYF